MRKLVAIRTSIATELLHGTLDKFGKNRDDEKRAVLMVLDTLLGVIPDTHVRYKELRKQKENIEQRSQEKLDSIHGNDVYSPMSNDDEFGV